MNTLKTIYDKLGDKTELAKHEVELSSAEVFNALKDAKNKINGVGNTMSDASSKIGDAIKLYAVAKTKADDYIKAIKSLDPSLLNSDQAKQINKYIGMILGDLETTKQMQSNISKIGSIASQFKMN